VNDEVKVFLVVFHSHTSLKLQRKHEVMSQNDRTTCGKAMFSVHHYVGVGKSIEVSTRTGLPYFG
jgi:hypothetical protein